MDSKMPAVKLLGYWRSSATWRLRLYFNFKGIEFEYVPVNLVKGEQRSDDHAALNPSKLVPVVIV